MSLLNNHNAHNNHNVHNNHNAHSYLGGGSSGLAAASAQALLQVRDAIAPLEAEAPAAPAPRSLDTAKRLRRIEFPFAVSALLSELGEGLEVSAEQDAFVISASGRDLVRIQPPSDASLQDEAKLVAGYAELRAERLTEILVQAQQIHPVFMASLPLSSAWTPSLVLLAAVAEEMATAMVQRAKLGFGLPRPHVLMPGILPMIPCPGHSSFPSGHATQAFALAGLLSAFTGQTPPDLNSPLDRIAARIAVNRTVAGLHYPSDSAAGAVLGLAIARWMAARATDAEVRGTSLDSDKWGIDSNNGSRDFHLPALCGAWKAENCLKQGETFKVGKAPLLSALWEEAQKEWGERWG